LTPALRKASSRMRSDSVSKLYSRVVKILLFGMNLTTVPVRFFFSSSFFEVSFVFGTPSS